MTPSRSRGIAAEWTLLALLGTWFVVKGLVPAWRELQTDFPNYFVAATLYRNGFSLDRAYEWTWFQRQKDHLGIDWGVVGWVPLSPYSALLMVPFTWLPPLVAKHAWIVINLGFLGATAALLRALTELPARRVGVLIFLTVIPLQTNFQFGQQYVVVLLLFALAAYLYLRDQEFSAGAVLAVAASIKLFPVAFGVFFVVKRRWRAAFGLGVAGLGLVGLSVVLFGFETMRVYAFDVLPRSLAGEANDPFYLGFNTLTVLLRRLVIAEPDLNPHPLVHATAAYVVLQPLLATVTLASALWLLAPAGRRPARDRLEWGAFVALLLVGSTESSTYHFCPLILSTALAVDFLRRAQRPRAALVLVALHVLIALPLSRYAPVEPSGWSVFLGVPRLYALLAYWGVYLWALVRVASPEPRPRRDGVLFAMAGLAMLASGVRGASRHFEGLADAARERVIGAGSDTVSAAPAAAGDAVYYSRMVDEGFALGQAGQSGGLENLRGTDLLHPALARSGALGWVEISSRRSQIASFSLAADLPAALPVEVDDGEDPSVSGDARWLAFLRERPHGRAALWVRDRRAALTTPAVALTDESYDVLDHGFFPDGRIVFSARRVDLPQLFVTGPTPGPVVPLPTSEARVRYPAVSPDGRWLAYAALERGAWQLRLLDLRTHEARHFARLDCNSISPTWSDDAATIFFASDCNRNVGNTALVEVRAESAAP